MTARWRQRWKGVAGTLVALGVLLGTVAPSHAAGVPVNPRFEHGTPLMNNTLYPWAAHGFVYHWQDGQGLVCGVWRADYWRQGCWIEFRHGTWHRVLVGYGPWYQKVITVRHVQWVKTYGWVAVHSTQQAWEVVKPAYTTTAYKQVLVQTPGWRTITQNVWEPGNTPSGTPTKWYAIAVPQWMVNWGYNPAALDGTPNPSTITPGPTSPGPHNGGKIVQETTRYWGTWLTTKTVAYRVHHPATYGWVTVPVTTWRWEVTGGYWHTWDTYAHVWTRNPIWGWREAWSGPGRPCWRWYGPGRCDPAR